MYTDYKAFDKVNDSILLQKLVAYGISHSMRKYYLYADNLEIFRSILSLNDIAMLPSNLICLHTWCTVNDMSFNINRHQLR